MFEKSEILDSELESFFSDVDPFMKIFQIGNSDQGHRGR